jgi:hypothetical protein
MRPDLGGALPQWRPESRTFDRRDCCRAGINLDGPSLVEGFYNLRPERPTCGRVEVIGLSRDRVQNEICRTGIHSRSGKKNGSTSRMHPMSGLSWGPIGVRRYRPIRCLTSLRLRAPFPSPKASHAMFTGSFKNFAKKPPPAMKLRGECSLNRNGSPGLGALKVASGDGRQKLTSS